jgi:hypothetical protein
VRTSQPGPKVFDRVFSLAGRGGPGLWLARELEVGLTGVDFSPVAVSRSA